MRLSFRALALVTFLLLAPAIPLLGCGDKYLSVGRGSRFQRGYVSLRPVSIAVFKHDETGRKDFLTRLKLAGHRVESTEELSKLATLVESSKADVVLAGYSDAVSVRNVLESVSRKPLFLPVVDASSIHAAAAQKEYGCLLNGDAKDRRRSFLAILDVAVESTREAKPVQCDLAK